MFIVNNDCEGLHWFVCAMDYTVPLHKPPTPSPCPIYFATPLKKRILFHNPRTTLLPPPPSSGKLENLLPPKPPIPRMWPQMGNC